MSAPSSLSMSLPLRSEWANVDLVRTSILNCFTVVFSDIDGSRTVAMVVGELLENAIKFGVWSGDDRRLKLEVTGARDRAVVTVENPVDVDGARQLLEALEALRAAPSADEAYRARLLAVAAIPGVSASSKLGLARIASEGNCTIEATVDGGVARVTATLTY